MLQIPTSDLKNKFGTVMRQAEKGTVEITRHGEVVAYLMAPNIYENMGGNRARLLALMKSMQAEAKANGLTQEILDEILKEDE